MPTLTTTKRSDSGGGGGAIATWALAVAQLVSWGSIYYAFSLFVVPMEGAMGWSRTATNAALSVGPLISGLAAYPVGTWIDHGHGRRVMVCGTVLAAAMLALWSQAHSLVTLFVVWIGLGVAMAATLYDPVFAVITRDFPRSFRNDGLFGVGSCAHVRRHVTSIVDPVRSRLRRRKRDEHQANFE